MLRRETVLAPGRDLGLSRGRPPRHTKVAFMLYRPVPDERHCQETPPMTATLQLIGVPTDIGASTRGAGMGPDALRVAGIEGTLARLGFQVLDTGNLSGPATPWITPAEGLHHLDEVVTW